MLAQYKEIFNNDLDGPYRKQDWSYRYIVGMLQYLVKSTRPDLSYAAHQCEQFAVNQKNL